MPDNIICRSPETSEEWQDYFHLRWVILRKAWHQPPGSERDEHEDDSFHQIAIKQNMIVGVGRVHQIDMETAQIRYMAVTENLQGRGIGSLILSALEDRAKHYNCKKITLNARDTYLDFYRAHGYIAVGEGPVLYNVITHSRMEKIILS